MLSSSACSLPAVPAAPGPTAAGSPTASPGPGPSTAPTVTPSPSAATGSPDSTPSGFPTYSRPAEPACALPTDTQDSVPGADGPVLTVKSVARAWRASEPGKSWGVSTGRLKASDQVRTAMPGAVLGEVGTGWASVDYFEWYGLSTFVYADQGRAAAKLVAVRKMLHDPCSYPFGAFGPYVVATLTEDASDHLLVSGTMERSPITELFVRHGNTVTHFSAMVMPLEVDKALSLIDDTLARA